MGDVEDDGENDFKDNYHGPRPKDDDHGEVWKLESGKDPPDTETECIETQQQLLHHRLLAATAGRETRKKGTGDQLIHLSGTVEGVAGMALLDSGAQLDVIYSPYLKRLRDAGVEVKQGQKRFTVAGALEGKTLQTHSTTLTFKVPTTSGEVWTATLEDCAIIEHPNPSCDLIIGRPSMRELAINVFSNDRVTATTTRDGTEREAELLPAKRMTFDPSYRVPGMARSFLAVHNIKVDFRWADSKTKRKSSEKEDKEDVAFALEKLNEIPDEEWEDLERKKFVESLFKQYPGLATDGIRLAAMRQEGIDANLPPLPVATIKVRDGADIPNHRPQQLNKQLQMKLNEKINSMLKGGVIKHSSSPWSSRALFFPKPSKPDDFRLVVDYRQLNAQTEKNNFAIPTIPDCLARLTGAKIFSQLDFKSWFDQLSLSKESSELTTFTTCVGNFSYCGLPQGLIISANFAQQVLNQIFSTPDEYGHFLDTVVFYIDDVVIRSEDEKNHERDLRRVLRRLYSYGVQLSVPKCRFFRKEINFLGHHIDARSDEYRTLVRPTPKIVEDIQKFPRPRNQRDCQRFSGLVVFFHTLIPDCAKIMAPITDLMGIRWSASEKDLWTSEHDDAFKTIKKVLSSYPVVALPQQDRQFYLNTDASDRAFGGVLNQMGEDGKLHPVLYISKKFSKTEKNWFCGEKELWPLVFTLRRYGHLLWGTPYPIIFQSDHKPLEHFQSWKLTPKLARWLDTLNMHQWEFQYIKGEDNVVADCLSRRPDMEDEESVQENPWENVKALFTIAQVQATKEDESEKGQTLEIAQPEGQRVLWDIFSAAVREADDSMHSESEVETWCAQKFELFHTEIENELEEAGFEGGFDAEPTGYEVLAKELQKEARKRNTPRRSYDPGEFEITEKTEEQRISSEGIGLNNAAVPDLAFLIELGNAYEEDDQGIRNELVKGDEKVMAGFALTGNGMVFRKEEPHLGYHERRLYIPKKASGLWGKVIHWNHDNPWEGGHFSVEKTIRKVERSYYWPDMRRDIRNACKRCDACQLNNPITRKHHLPTALPMPKYPFEVIAFDEKTGMPQTPRGNNAFVVFVDFLSRRVIVEAIPVTIDALQLARIIQKRVIGEWGTPRKIVMDRDSKHTSRTFDAFCEALDSKRALAAVGNPRSSAIAERAIRSTLESLRKYISDIGERHKSDWDLFLPAVQYAYNDSVHPRLGVYTPFEVSIGRSPRQSIESIVNGVLPPGERPHADNEWGPHFDTSLVTRLIPDFPIEDFIKRCQEVQTDAKRYFKESAVAELEKRRKRYAYSTPFLVGQKVLWSRKSLKGGMGIPGPISERKWGPYIIKEVGRNDTYVLDLKSCPKEKERTGLYQGKDIAYVPGEQLSLYREILPDTDWENDIIDDNLDQIANSNTVDKKTVEALLSHVRMRLKERQTLRVLDVGCGTKSLEKALREVLGDKVTIEYTSIDYDTRYSPTYCWNVRDWKKELRTLRGDEREKFDKGYFDIAWYSPNCAPRSSANTTGVRDLDTNEEEVKAAADFFEEIQPQSMFWENPESSKFQLRDAPWMRKIENRLKITPHSTTYCCYGYGYQKKTTIWSTLPINLRHCDANPCPAKLRLNRHLYTAQSGPSSNGTPGVPRELSYSVPPLLLQYLIFQAFIHTKI